MKTPPTPAKRLLCLWLPNWPIQRLGTAIAGDAPDVEPGTPPDEPLPEGPIVLWGIDPRRGRLVVACCQRAAALGVRVGMTIGEADSLLRGSHSSPAPAKGSPPDSPLPRRAPRILQHDSEADLESLRGLAEACAGELSPIVAIEPLDDFLWAGQILHQPQSLLMDVTGVGDLFGDEQRLADAARGLLSRYRLAGRIAIADTAGAAWALAHYGTASSVVDAPESVPPWECGTGPSEAPAPTKAPAPVDIELAPSGETRAALAPLPVAALRIRAETAVMLRRLGVERIDALLRLPRSGLATRLGVDLLRRLDQALGEVDEPLPAHHAAATDRASVDLEYPTRDLDILRHQLDELVRRVARGLSERQRGVLRLCCRFDLQQPPPLEIRVGLFTPSATADHLLRLLSGHLEKSRFPSPAHRIVVAATLTGPLGLHQPTLGGIGGGEHASVVDLARLVDGLSSRLGRTRVLGVELTDDPLPEQAVRLRPLTGQPVGAVVPGRPLPRRKTGRGPRRSPPTPSPTTAPRSTAAAGEPPTPADPLRRPLMMCSRPVRLIPMNRSGQPREGEETRVENLPARFRHGDRVHRIVRHWGPERLETGWWNGPMHRRDYYRIETDEGAWIWVYHDLRKNQWWLQGYFA